MSTSTEAEAPSEPGGPPIDTPLTAPCRLCGAVMDHQRDIFAPDDVEVSENCHRCLPLLITPQDELSKSICPSCAAELGRVRSFFDRCLAANRTQILELRRVRASPLDLETHLNQYVRSFQAPLVPHIKMEPAALCDVEWGPESDSGDENDENYAPEADGPDGESPSDEMKPSAADVEADELGETRRGRWASHRKRSRRAKPTFKHFMEENLNRPLWPLKDEAGSDEDIPSPVKKRTRKKRTISVSSAGLTHCSKCDAQFEHHQATVEHWQEVHPEESILYRCPYEPCEFSNQEAEAMETHQSQQHPHMSDGKKRRDAKFEDCKICGKSYPINYLYSRHMLSHSDQKDFKCHVCEKDFKSGQDLKTHLKVHGSFEEKYTHCCELCGKRFTQRSNLDSHLRVHSGFKPYNCDFCEKTFSQKGNMEEHRRTHTGEKPFVCELCGSAFVRRSELQLHMRCVHTGERPYQCAYCPKNFQRRDLLRKHERIHTDTRPYQCQYCQKAFTQRDKMVVHTRLHTGERPYVCDICNKGFCESGNLKKHLRVHGKEAPAVMHQNNKGKPAPGGGNPHTSGGLSSKSQGMDILGASDIHGSHTENGFAQPKDEEDQFLSGAQPDRTYTPLSQQSDSTRGTPLPPLNGPVLPGTPLIPLVPKVEQQNFAFPMNLHAAAEHALKTGGDDQSDTASERSLTPSNPPQPAHMSSAQIPYAAMHPLMQHLSGIRETWYGGQGNNVSQPLQDAGENDN